MPKYEVDIPGQGTFEVDSPSALTDVQAYQIALAQIKPPAPPPQTGLGASLKRGLGQLISPIQTGVESFLPGENVAENAALKGLQRQEELAKKYASAGDLEKVKKAYQDKGLLSAAGEVLSQVPGAITEQVPQLGAMIAGAKIGSVGGPWGAAIGAATPLFLQFVGSNLERQAQEQIAKGDPVSVDRGNAVLGAIPQTALDVVQQRFLFGSKLFSQALGIPEKELLAMSARKVEKLAAEKLLPTLLKGTGKGIIAEIPTEVGQQIIERAQAGLPLTSPDALMEYGQTAYGVSLLGPLGALGRISEKGAARQQLAAQAAAPTPAVPVPTTPAAPTGQLQLPLEGGEETAGPRLGAPIAPAAALPDEATISTLRDQYDTLSREIERLGAEFERTQDPAKKQQLLVQGQRLDFARRDINSQLMSLKPAPITAPEGQMALDFTQPEPEVDLSYYQPKTKLAEPTIIGQQPAPAVDTTGLRLDALRRMRDAGEALTPAEQFQLRELEKAEQAKPAPQFEVPTEVGTGARPTSYVVDDAAIDTFGLSKKATKLRDAVRGLDLMKAEDLEKFNDLVEKHERKPGAKIDMEAVDAFKQSIPESVPAREVPEAAGLPAREYTPRQQYQQAREAMFAFGQEAAPISSRDRAILAKQKYEAENGRTIPDVGARTSEPSVQLPSGELEPTAGITAPAATGLAGAEPVVRRAPARERAARETKPAALSPFEQMIQQVAPEGKPDLKEEKAKPKKRGFGEIEKPAPTRKGTAYREAELDAAMGDDLVPVDRTTVGYTPQRIKSLLSEYAESDYDLYPNASNAYVGHVSPEDFLAATTQSPEQLRYLETDRYSRPLNVEDLAAQSQPIYLVLDENFKLIGHEGRHRMIALRNEGIKKVPVVFRFWRIGDRLRKEDTYIPPQKFSGDLVIPPEMGQKGFYVDELVPVTYPNKAELTEKFGAKEGQIAYRTAPVNMTGMSVKDVQDNVNRIVEGWKNSPLIQVVQRVDQLPEPIQRQIEQDNVERPQGVWDDDSNAVFLIADNLVEPKDVALTVAHEALGHFGLRTILGNNYSKEMNNAYRNAEVKRRADAKIARGMDKEIAVEEVLAEMAEKGKQPNLINRFVNMIRNWLRGLGVNLKSVTNAEILQLLKDSRQYVIEGKGEAGKGGMKIGKVFSGDAPVFYSKLAAMTQHAPKNLRDGASGKAWADWINSNAGKFGVKKEEIQWSGIDDLLGLMEKSLKFTSKDVNDMLKEEGVKVEEAVYGGGINVEAARKLRQEENRLNNLAFDLAEEMLTKNVFTPNTWYYKQAVGYNRDKAKPDAQLGDYLENIHVPILEGTFDTNLFDPDLEDTYTEKVRSIQKALANLTTEQDKVYGKTTRFDSYKTHGGENYTELVLTLPTVVQYNHPHWPGVHNPIAHTRFSEFTDADGKRVILVDEVQSDWGQEGQESGFGTRATDAEYGAVVNTRTAAEIAYAQAVRRINQEQGTNYSETPVRWRPIPEELKAEAESVINLRELAQQVLEETKRVPKAPFVQDTKVWTALVVKRLLRYATDNGIDRIAFIDGETAHKRFPTNKQGDSTEKGMKTYYDQILPSVVKDVLRKLGADSKPVRSDIELTPKPGYSVFVNNDLVAGPFDNEADAWAEGAELTFSGEVDPDDIKIKSADMPEVKSFTAFDIAPETAEKVKEGQAMFRGGDEADYRDILSRMPNSLKALLQDTIKKQDFPTYPNAYDRSGPTGFYAFDNLDWKKNQSGIIKAGKAKAAFYRAFEAAFPDSKISAKEFFDRYTTENKLLYPHQRPRSVFRSAEGDQAEQLMGAFGGATPKENLKFVDRQKAKFEKAKDEWQSHYNQNQSWVGATFGKGQNIASFDQAFNNRLYNHFMALKKQGNMVMDEVKQALLRISTSQALHRQNLANQIIDRGNYSYDADSNRWAAVDDQVNMTNFESVITKLATRLGVEPTRAKQIMGAAYEANRLDSMYKDLNQVQAELARAEKDLLKLKDPKQRGIKNQLINALKEKEEALEGKVRHKTPAQVAAGMQLYNSSPEIQEGTRIWNTMRERVIKMLVETGVKTEKQAKDWFDEAAYVPFFRDMGEESRIGPKIMARGLRESMRDYRMKGSEKEVADVIDNMYKWMQWSIARSISNKQLQVMADNYAKYLPNEIQEGKSGSDSSFVIYRGGVPKYYTVADPAVGQAFTGLEPLFFPAINYMAAPSNFLRHAVTRNPIFAASQLFMDSYTAMFTSGLKNPFGLLKEIAKETVATIRGTSDTREMLKRSGILETHDYAALSEADAIGYRLNLDKPGAWAKLAQRLDKMAAGSDNVIRQGIYNQAIKEGLSHTEAMEKATEIVNFRRVSGSPTVQLLSRVVPFFNAYMQVASVAAKTLSGRGISPQERAEATKVLMATTAKITALSMLYSMAVGDDEDYLRKNRVTRDRMWMIPGTGGMGIPVRMDVFALPKIAGEYGYQMMSDTAYTDSKMVKSAIARAIKGSINPPSEGIPQLVRPALGVMMNYDSFQDREIVNATMRRLDPEMQYNKNTSEMAKALGAMTGMSPLQLDFLLRGYLGSLATIVSLGTNDVINAARGAPPRPERSIGDIIASLPSVGGFMSKEENTAVLSDYYEVARDVNRAVDSLSSMKYASAEEKKAYREEHKKELALKAPVQAINKMLVNLKRQEQMIREAPESRMSAEVKQEKLRRIDAQRSRLAANVARIRQKLYNE